MAKLIHSISLAAFKTAFQNWAVETDNPAYKSVVFTDDGYLYTHGKVFKIDLYDGAGLTDFSRDGLTAKITVSGVTKSMVLPSLTTTTSTIITVSDPTGKGNYSIAHGNKLSAAGSFVSSVSNYQLTPTGANYDTYGHITSIKTGTAVHLDYVARTADNATTTALPLFFGKTDSTNNPSVVNYVTNISVIPSSGTIKATIFNENGTNLSAKYADKSAFDTHTSTTATASVLGHIKLIDSYSETNDTTKGLAATPKAVYQAYTDAKTYVNNLLAELNGAMVFKGTIGNSTSGATVTSLPTAKYSAGWTYRVVTAGNYAGQACEIGDLIIAIKDGPTSGTSVVNADWTVAQTNIDGAVISSSTLTANTLILGNGNKTVKSLANGSKGQILQFNGTTPAWVTASFARQIKVNGTEILAANTSTALDLKSGNNISITNSGGAVTIAASGLVTSDSLADLSFSNGGTALGTYNATSAATVNVDGGLKMKAEPAGTYNITHANSSIDALNTATPKKIAYDAYGHITGTEAISNLVIKIKSGTTENKDIYTYNGNDGKTLDIKQGSNVTLTTAAGSLTIAAKDTLYKLVVGGSSATSNATTSNGNTYLRLLNAADNTASGSFKITGSGATKVTSDASGNITIDSLNSWRSVYAWELSDLGVASPDTIDKVLAESTGTDPLRFGSSFAYDGKGSKEIELVWLEIDASGNKTYAI